jgi:hypothetical protein
MTASAGKGHLVPSLIRAAYPDHAAKRWARAAAIPVETARNHLRGRATPSAATLLRAAAHCERIANALARLADDLEGRRATAARPSGEAAGKRGSEDVT